MSEGLSPSHSGPPSTRRSTPRGASPAKYARALEAVPDGANTPAGGRTIRRDIEDVALSRKPSPLKKKQVLDLWENYRKKLWDDTCEDCNVDPFSVRGKSVQYHLASTRSADPLSTLTRLRRERERIDEPAFPSQSTSEAATSVSGATSNLPDILPMDLVLRVRQILCQIQNEDIANMKPGYFQELVTLGHLVIRRSQEYYY